MDKELNKNLLAAAASTFEELCFMSPSPEMGDLYQQAKTEATASVEFLGLFRGRLVLGVCGRLLSVLAANMLGEEDAPPLQEQYDALGEIANVICGNVLPSIAGAREVLDLSPPQVAANARTTPPDGEKMVAEAHLVLEQGRADLMLFLQGGLPISVEEKQK